MVDRWVMAIGQRPNRIPGWLFWGLVGTAMLFVAMHYWIEVCR